MYIKTFKLLEEIMGLHIHKTCCVLALGAVSFALYKTGLLKPVAEKVALAGEKISDFKDENLNSEKISAFKDETLASAKCKIDETISSVKEKATDWNNKRKSKKTSSENTDEDAFSENILEAN